MEDLLIVVVVLAVGIGASIVNTVAGGGSYLTLPLLVFLGLDAQMANATNRLAITGQAAAATGTFRRAGMAPLRDGLGPALAALAGAVPGAWLATVTEPERFRALMGWILLGGIVLLLVKPRSPSPGRWAGDERALASTRRSWVAIPLAFLFGVYGGFLGAGIGVLILLFLRPVLDLGMVQMVAVKVLMLLFLSLAATVLFVAYGQVHWQLGVPLAAGNVLGGVIGARLTLRAGEVWVRRGVAVVAAGLAVALLAGWAPL